MRFSGIQDLASSTFSYPKINPFGKKRRWIRQGVTGRDPLDIPPYATYSMMSSAYLSDIFSKSPLGILSETLQEISPKPFMKFVL